MGQRGQRSRHVLARLPRASPTELAVLTRLPLTQPGLLRGRLFNNGVVAREPLLIVWIVEHGRSVAVRVVVIVIARSRVSVCVGGSRSCSCNTALEHPVDIILAGLSNGGGANKHGHGLALANSDSHAEVLRPLLHEP